MIYVRVLSSFHYGGSFTPCRICVFFAFKMGKCEITMRRQSEKCEKAKTRHTKCEMTIFFVSYFRHLFIVSSHFRFSLVNSYILVICLFAFSLYCIFGFRFRDPVTHAQTDYTAIYQNTWHGVDPIDSISMRMYNRNEKMLKCNNSKKQRIKDATMRKHDNDKLCRLFVLLQFWISENTTWRKSFTIFYSSIV